MLRLLLLAFLLVSGTSALAERRVALVFGSDAYRTLRPLENAGADADAIADALEALGFEVTKEQDRDLRRMRRALEDFEADHTGADVALIYYAGHGVEIAGSNRLLPVDADATSLETLLETSLPLDEVRAAARRVAPVVLILIDACRDDPMGSSGTEGRGGTRLSQTPSIPLNPGFGRMGESADTLFAFAAAPGASALDGADDHSPFTSALLKYLGAEGLEIRSVLTLVQQEVYDRTGGHQLPYIENGLPRLFFAGTAPGALPERERLLLAMADLTPDLRAEVESVAARTEVPLAPLYSALLAADLAHASAAIRQSELEAAAAAYGETLGRLATLASSDPEVTRLRAQAETALKLGALAEAEAALDQAIAVDRASRLALGGNLIERTVSEAASLQARAGIALTALDRPVALASLEKASALMDSVAALPGMSDEDHQGRVDLLHDLSLLYVTTGDTLGAKRSTERMMAAADLRANAPGASISARIDKAIAQGQIGMLAMAMGDTDRAMRDIQAARAALESLLVEAPEDLVARRYLGTMLGWIGGVHRMQGNFDASARAYDAQLAIAEALVAADPEDKVFAADLAQAYLNSGATLRAHGAFEPARAAYRQALTVSRELSQAYPDDLLARDSLAEALQLLGEMDLILGRPEAAQGSYQEALDTRLALVARDPGNGVFQGKLAEVHMLQALLALELQDIDGALVSAEAALEIALAQAEADPEALDKRDALGRAYLLRGDTHRQLRDRDGAARDFLAGLAELDAILAVAPDHGLYQRHAIEVHMGLARIEIAPRAHVQAALALLRDMESKGTLVPGELQWIPFLEDWLARLGGADDGPALMTGEVDPAPPETRQPAQEGTESAAPEAKREGHGTRGRRP